MAEDDVLKLADIPEVRERFAAEAEKLRAEGEEFRQKARVAEFEAENALMDLDSKRRSFRDEMAADKYHYRYHFKEGVTSPSVSSCMEQLKRWTRQEGENKQTIEIVFTSPGGSVFDGLVLFDFIQELKRDGHTINTNTLGMAASMAGILLQAGSTRTMAAEAWVLIHEISAGALGKVGEIEDTVKFLKRIQDRVLNIFIERSKQAHKDSKKKHPKVLTLRFMRGKWKKTDWWLSSDDCLEYGIVDEVV